MSESCSKSASAEGTEPADVELRSRLGFGTSALMSRVNRRESLRLIQTALDAGITHFDTARSYGFGEAEYVLGEGLHGRLDQVTITTKLGILPPRRGAGLSVAKAMTRALLSVVPGARAGLRRCAGSLTKAGHFDTATMTDSLNTSLRALGTDSVDYLLLHEPDATVLATDAPLQFLERVRAEGKVRRFGIAVPLEVVGYALSRAPGYTGVLQCPIDALTEFAVGTDTRVLVPGEAFLHSVLSRWLPGIQAQLAADARKGSGSYPGMQLDLGKPGVLLRFALQASLRRHAPSHLLFTSTQPEHIRANAAALETAASADQLLVFERLMGLVASEEERLGT